jgi:putative addiction module component (TIGR02574 family)
MASSGRLQRALAAATELSAEEREELIAGLVLGLERDREPEPGYEEAWSAEIRRRVDEVVRGKSQGAPWSQVRREIAAKLAERERSALSSSSNRARGCFAVASWCAD